MGSCQSNPKTSYSSLSVDITKVDSIENAKRLKDSLSKVEELKCIGNINFGISKSVFNKEIEIFKNKSRNESKSDFYYYIGNFPFFRVNDFYYKNKLYYLILYGESVHYEKYKQDVVAQVSSLKETITGKFGEPDNNYGIPDWTSIEKGYTRTCFGWRIGDKVLQIKIENQGVYYYVQLHIYLDSIETKVNIENSEKKSQENKSAKNVF